MRTVLTYSLVLGLCLTAPWGRLCAADPSAWPGFPTLENGDVNSDGEHVIHFKAAFPELQFQIDVTYNITVD